MTDKATAALSDLITRKGIKVSAICDSTGLKPNAVYPSLSGKRALRADEFLSICSFSGIDPMSLFEATKTT